ncbi:MAG: Ku protein [Acidobacteriota bacterium]|nr:Ku protein [Acidobacteriota bacterium]
MAAIVWKGHLTFGLVSFPVKLYSAARSETISFNQLHKSDGSRVRQVLYCAAEDKPIPRTEIVKGYEYEKDRYVVIEDEDIKKVAPQTAKVMEIQEFVKADAVDPIYLETSYYMAPDQAGEKPYALLFDALKKSGYMGIAKVTMHNREHVVILRPGANGVLLHTMYFSHEIRKVDEFRTDLSLVKEKELALAQSLVQALAAEFEPDKYKDTYRENLLQMIESKKEGKEIVATPEPHQEKVVDILEALKASLAVAKKPAASARAVTSIAEAKPAKRKARG